MLRLGRMKVALFRSFLLPLSNLPFSGTLIDLVGGNGEPLPGGVVSPLPGPPRPVSDVRGDDVPATSRDKPIPIRPDRAFRAPPTELEAVSPPRPFEEVLGPAPALVLDRPRSRGVGPAPPREVS